MEASTSVRVDPFAIALRLLRLGYSMIPSGGGDKEKSPPVSWQAYRPLHEVLEREIQHLIAGKPNGIERAMLLQIFVDLRTGEGGVSPEVEAHHSPLMADNDGLQHLPPVMGAANVTRPQHGALTVAELVKHEGRG